ncbi:MAG: DciA family protein [Wenzhouxiangella sp.]
MDKPRARPVQAVLDGNRSLSALLRAGRAFDELEKRLRPHMSEISRETLRVACVDGDTLVLSVTTPAWASRARMEAPRLLYEAQAIWPTPLRRFQVIVENRTGG